MAEQSSPAKEHFDKGNSLQDSRNWDEAILEYNEAIKLDPYFASAYYNRGIVYAEKINIEKINRIPMLLFISNYCKWENLIREYIKDFEMEILTYNAGHYLHNIFPDDISNKSKIFIKNIIK